MAVTLSQYRAWKSQEITETSCTHITVMLSLMNSVVMRSWLLMCKKQNGLQSPFSEPNANFA